MTVGTLLREPGSLVQLETNGAQLIAGDYLKCTNDLLAAANAGFPLVDFIMALQFTLETGISSGGISLISQPAGAEPPSDIYPHDTLGTFQLNEVTTVQNPRISGVTRQAYDQSLWIKNISGQTINVGWSLDATPASFAPSAA